MEVLLAHLEPATPLWTNLRSDQIVKGDGPTKLVVEARLESIGFIVGGKRSPSYFRIEAPRGGDYEILSPRFFSLHPLWKSMSLDIILVATMVN